MLKVLKANFPETNLTIFLEDTTLQFLVVFSQNPARNYYSYLIPPKEVKVTNITTPLMTSNSNKTDFEKSAAQFINPRNKIFSLVRSKNQNANYGEYHKGVRVFVEKLYKSGNQTFMMLKVINLSMGEFQIDEITVQKFTGQEKKSIEIINEEAAYNNLKRGEKIEFVLVPNLIDLDINEKLLFSIKSNDRKDAVFKFEITAKDFKKRESL
jgi:hypothetical protein